MEVILLETFDRLGKIGDVVKVKDGFARNFLIPQKKALRANDANKDYFAKIKSDLLEKSKKSIDEANIILKKIVNKDIIFIRNASDNGQLYGSVSPKDISNYFAEQKVDIKPSSINLYTAIKKIGIYDINIKLHAEVTCTLKINVATSEENAIKQKDELNKPKESKQNDKNELDKKTATSGSEVIENKKEFQQMSNKSSDDKDVSTQIIKEDNDPQQ